MRFSEQEVQRAISPASTRNVMADRRDKSEFIRQLFSEGRTLEECVTIAHQLPSEVEMERLKQDAANSSFSDARERVFRSPAKMSEYERLVRKRQQLVREAAELLGIST